MKFILNTVIGLVVIGTAFFVYQKYGDDVDVVFLGEQSVYTVYVDKVALSVTVADSESERKKGLSGVPSLRELEGKLFIFDTAQRHGVWMNEMNFPIDVLWFDDDLELVSFEKDVTPESYPNVFAPTTDARFILEMNAKFIDSVQIQLGDRLLLPSSILPSDVRNNLQE